jgi:hypothetical protein
LASKRQSPVIHQELASACIGNYLLDEFSERKPIVRRTRTSRAGVTLGPNWAFRERNSFGTM